MPVNEPGNRVETVLFFVTRSVIINLKNIHHEAHEEH